ncbi:MAG: hypothetical protein RL748_75 [Pseudomonadota bacterium]|jgi:DNA-binding NarL/FixJ family response regulator
MRQKILVVDDSPFIGLVVTTLLQARFDVESARSTAEMREKLTKQHYALALLDLELQDGVRVTRLLPEIKKQCDKVIIFSQTGEQTDFNACVTAAVDGYVSKSSEYENLENVIDMVMAGHQAFPPTRLMAYGSHTASHMQLMDDSQRAVFNQLLCHPMPSNAQIAKVLTLSESRVAGVLTSLYKLFGVSGRAALLELAR